VSTWDATRPSKTTTESNLHKATSSPQTMTTYKTPDLTLTKLWHFIQQLEIINALFALYLQALPISTPSTQPSQPSNENLNQVTALKDNPHNSVMNLVFSLLPPPALYHLHGITHPCIPPWPPPLPHTKTTPTNKTLTTTPVQCSNNQAPIWKKDSLTHPSTNHIISAN